jgi:hypothetical protein
MSLRGVLLWLLKWHKPPHRRVRYLIRLTFPDGTYFQGGTIMSDLLRGKTATLSLVNLKAADGGPGAPPSDVEFQSSDASVAQVSGDQLAALANGTAQVSATFIDSEGNGGTATPASLSVSDPPAVSADVAITPNP